MQGGVIVIPRKNGYLDTNYIYMYNSRRSYSTSITAADVTTANVQDNQMYIPLTSALSVFSLPLTCYMIADSVYDDRKLYEYSKKVLGIDLIVCPPVKRYESTPKKRLEIVCFYQSALGQAIYNQRRISIEPLIEHIKSVFKMDPLPARGLSAVSAIVLLSVLLYQLMVYYNCRTMKINPKSIKYMLETG